MVMGIQAATELTSTVVDLNCFISIRDDRLTTITTSINKHTIQRIDSLSLQMVIKLNVCLT